MITLSCDVHDEGRQEATRPFPWIPPTIQLEISILGNVCAVLRRECSTVGYTISTVEDDAQYYERIPSVLSTDTLNTVDGYHQYCRRIL